jgi:hypothetical protein
LYFQLRQLHRQVRQAEKNQQAAIRQGRATRIVDINLAITEPSIAEAVSRGIEGSEDMTSTQVAQFSSYCRARFYGAEDAFYQHNEGLLNESAFVSFVANMKNILTSPGMRIAWRTHRCSYGTEFVEFMDKIIAETPVAWSPNALSRWKTDIVAEKATGTAA